MVLHREPQLTSGRLLPTWALFAFAAGAVNAGALLACQRFVAHVTGTVTRIGVDAGGFLAVDYFLVLLAFLAGATGAILLVRRVPRGSDKPAYWVPLGIVCAVLFAVALAGSAGALGAFGGSVETAHDFALLAILSFAMGMQNAAVAASTGMTVRTTHMTGPVTDIGVALATLVSGSASEREKAWRSLVLRGTKLGAFIVGGAAMALLCPRVHWLAFLLPATAGLAATIRSFLPASITTNGDESDVPASSRV